MSLRYHPGVSPPLGMEKWNRRFVITMRDIWEFFLAFGAMDTGPNFQQYAEAAQTYFCEYLFNPNSSFGRAILKLHVYTRASLLLKALGSGVIFKVSVTQRRIKPLLRRRKRKPSSSPSLPPTFHPPLYLTPVLPPLLSFPVLRSLSCSLLIVLQLLFDLACPLEGPPRQGVG